MQAAEKITTNKPFHGSRRELEINNMLREFPILRDEIAALKAEIASLNAKIQTLKEQKKGDTRTFV